MWDIIANISAIYAKKWNILINILINKSFIFYAHMLSSSMVLNKTA